MYQDDMLRTFHQLHRQRYGSADDQRAVEIVNVRVRIVAKAEPFTPCLCALKQGNGEQAFITTRPVFFAGQTYQTPIYSREKLCPGDTLTGPAIISEYSSATILPPGDLLHVDALDNLIIEVQR